MKIVCPSCNAAYEVPDDRLAPGRVVRCARCSADWMPIATLVAPPVEPVTLPALPPPTQEEVAVEVPRAPVAYSELPSPRRGGAAVAVAWLLSFAVIGAAGWAGVTYRTDIMRAWPPSERAYLALGLR